MATPEQKMRRRSSATRSPDTLSPLWPDRPIRPLPKNRLRSKLSPEQAESIVFPPNPPQTSPLFSFPYGLSDAQEGRMARVNGHRHSSPSTCNCGGFHPDNSDEEEAAYDHPSYRWSSPGAEGASTGGVQQRLLDSRGPGKAPPASASTESSADSYASWENTSNKKKRKIPISGGSGAHHSSLSAEMANMGISSPQHATEGYPNGSVTGAMPHVPGPYPVATGAGNGGASRARLSRQVGKADRRSGSHVQGPNGYMSSLSASSRGGNYTSDGVKSHQGPEVAPISTSNVNIGEAPAPVTPPEGKENIALLSPQSDKAATPNSQFTFTCETDTSKQIAWPTQAAGAYDAASKKSYYPIRQRPAMANNANHGTQTAPSARAAPDGRMPAPPTPPSVQANPLDANGQPLPPKPRRRRPSKEFALAARQRRLAQEFNNYQSKPTKDSMWICEFCEYEDIWGYPPKALIRQYEIKDREERRKAEERRRLLEKAKMKNKKGKNKGKGGKNAANHATNHAGQPYDPNVDNLHLPPDGHGDEYYDDGYDDDEFGPVDPNEPAFYPPYPYPLPGEKLPPEMLAQLPPDIPHAPPG